MVSSKRCFSKKVGSWQPTTILDSCECKNSYLEELGEDLTIQIMIQLVSSSASALTDLANLKITCKMFQSVANDRLVLHNISLTKSFSWWFPIDYSEFLHCCLEAENPHAFYIQGMVECFKYKDKKSSCGWSNKAMKLGHSEATYILGLILFNAISTELQGIELLNKVENMELQNNGVKECRQKVKNILKRISINTILYCKASPCPNLVCRNDGRLGALRGGEWLWSERVEKEKSFCCQRCKWVIESNRFCRIFPQV